MTNSTVSMEIVSYGGWQNCVWISNGRIEIVVTTDVGPRIIRCGFVEEDNLFAEFKDSLGKTGGDRWRAYGGHRFWHAPEHPKRTYAPDNSPVKHEWKNGTLFLVQPVEQSTGIHKEMEITLHPEYDKLTVLHRLVNENLWDVTCAPWCLSVMAAGGEAYFPHEKFIPFPDQLLPARPLVLWSYTDMADPRWTWGTKMIQLRQDASRTDPQKIGFLNSPGWGAYVNKGVMFAKKTPLVPEAAYPDFGCSWEVYTNDSMLEMETLGPLTNMKAEGGTAEHSEEWRLVRIKETVTPEAVQKTVAGFGW